MYCLYFKIYVEFLSLKSVVRGVLNKHDSSFTLTLHTRKLYERMWKRLGFHSIKCGIKSYR